MRKCNELQWTTWRPKVAIKEHTKKHTTERNSLIDHRSSPEEEMAVLWMYKTSRQIQKCWLLLSKLTVNITSGIQTWHKCENDFYPNRPISERKMKKIQVTYHRRDQWKGISLTHLIKKVGILHDFLAINDALPTSSKHQIYGLHKNNQWSVILRSAWQQSWGHA